LNFYDAGDGKYNTLLHFRCSIHGSTINKGLGTDKNKIEDDIYFEKMSNDDLPKNGQT
jgi:hypothetical protein